MVRALVLALAATVALCCAPLGAQDIVLGQMYGQGVHAFFAGDYLEAHRLFTAAIEAGSKDPRAYYYRGLCLLNLQRPEQAPADFQRGAELESSEEGRIYNVGRALERVQGHTRLELEKYRVKARMARLSEERRLQQMRFEQLRGQQGAVGQQGQTKPELPAEPLPKPIEPGELDPFSAPKTKPQPPAPPGDKPVESPAEPQPPVAEPKPPQPQPSEPPAMPEQPPAKPEPQPESKPEPAVEPAPPKEVPGKPAVIDPFEVPSQPQPPKPVEPQPGQTEPGMPSQPGAEPGASPPGTGRTSVLGALRRAVTKAAAGDQSGEGVAPKAQPVPLFPPPVQEKPNPVPPPPGNTDQEPTPPAPKTEEPTPPAPPAPPKASDDPFSVPVPSKPTGPMKPAVEDPFSLEPPAPKSKP
jgi:hypothetical protein